MSSAAEHNFGAADATLHGLFDKALADHLRSAAALTEVRDASIALSEAAIAVIEAGGKILLCGNGGSAAECQHLATELTIRFERERRGLPAIALTADTTAITAAGNDYGFERVFSRQVEALGRPGDMLIAFTTSGRSPNVIRALEVAREGGLITACITGGKGGPVAERGLADHCVITPGGNTARIQELHLFITHVFCEALDVAFSPAP